MKGAGHSTIVGLTSNERGFSPTASNKRALGPPIGKGSDETSKW